MPASASHGIENIMAAPNLSSSDEGVGGLGMSFVGQPNRRWRSLKPCRIFSTDLPIFPSSLVTLKTRDKDVVRIWTCIFRTYSQVGSGKRVIGTKGDSKVGRDTLETAPAIKFGSEGSVGESNIAGESGKPVPQNVITFFYLFSILLLVTR